MKINKKIIKYIILFFFLILCCSEVHAKDGNNFPHSVNKENIEYLISSSSISDWKLFLNPESRSCKFFNAPTGIWLTEKFSNSQYVQKILAQAKDVSPIFVLYFIPTKENNEASEGKLKIYLDKNVEIAKTIGKHKAIVIVEPDVLYLSIDNPKDLKRNQQIVKQIVKIYKHFAPNTKVYLDAGHSNWIEPYRVKNVLNNSGIELADGFATNVSNFQYTEKEIKYAETLSNLLGNKSFVIDTSRNGTGPGRSRRGAPIWSDPLNVSTGIKPTTNTKMKGLDAFLWIKPPGEADGNILPAGTFDPNLVQHQNENI